ncbi:alpha beta-hydrolase [Micractinium conductrix]|uniref:Alpha beta-hydrolase n=1 Tax=Micractinium conductrix TaxID=554055 RepID=A0A2P6VG74_9CHLO|nr:alpha beta-hydrolase [Micractinium conductrix]|eukprot:PSC73077.1 alpha beta-hydrolase [Micractinium conductrix]
MQASTAWQQRLPAPAQRRHPRRAAAVATTDGAPAAAPSRAVVILPGLGNNAKDYAPLAGLLAERGLHVEVAPVARLDWARNAAGLRYAEYWQGTLKPRPTVDWYLQRVGQAVEAAKRATDGAPLTLLAHSAGGWLGRLYMLDFDRTGIDQFVSLGSPQLPPPEGVVDQTRGILTWVTDASPGAFHPEVSYTTLAGRYLKGSPLQGPGSWQQRVVGAGYQQVCGDATAWGDGVVPVPSAHLEGAQQMTLEGAYHSPLGASEDGRPIASVQLSSDDGEAAVAAAVAAGGTAGGAQARLWYGSHSLLAEWVHVLEAAGSPAAAWQ